jgi:uncharacterized protein (TIGR02596 family)
MNEPCARANHRRFPSVRGQRPPQSFTLVELLVVMAVIALLMLVAVPAMTSLLEGDRLTAGAQQVADQINLARQISSSRNITVELRVLKMSGVTTPGYTEIELGTNSSSTNITSTPPVWYPISRPSILPQNIAISESTTLSGAFSTTIFPAASGMPGTMTNSMYGPQTGAKYYPFEFRPSGIIAPVPNATTLSNMTKYCFTVVSVRFAASTYTALSSFKNYAVVQLDPMTSTPIVYRP